MRMRRLGWLAGSLLGFALVGCLEEASAGESSPAPAVLGTSGSGTLSYDNGHPILFDTDDAATLTVENDVATLTNNHRVALGLNALLSADAHADLGRAHSVHMILHDPSFFAHQNPEGDQPWDRATTAGISYLAFGENIAAGYATPESAFSAWLASQGHKDNIENPLWTHHGVGYAYASSDPAGYGHYWTHNFSRQ